MLVDGAGSLCSYRPDHALDLADWFFNLDNQTKMSLATKVEEDKLDDYYYTKISPSNITKRKLCLKMLSLLS